MKKSSKILFLISSLISLGMIYPLVFFYFKIKYALKITNFDGADPDEIDKVMSFSFSTPSFLITFIIFITLLVAQLIIASYLIVKGKTKQEKLFGKLTLIIGGLGINAIYALVIFIRNKYNNITLRSTNKVVSIIAISSSPLIALGATIGITITTGYDSQTNMHDIKYSTKVGKENIIEIFADGLDSRYMKDYFKNDQTLENFYLLDKFVVSGAETSYSLPTIIGGFKYNDFTDSLNSSSGGGMVKRYGRLIRAYKEHFNTHKSENTYFLNLNMLNGEAPYWKSISGDKDYAKSQLSSKVGNFLNWAQAKKDLSHFGVANYSPDSIFYEWANKHSKIDNSHGEGARVFLQEFITHNPRLSNNDGTLSFKTGDQTLKDAISARQHEIDKFLKHLKELKDSSGRSVYENSLILIYGDHANHNTPLSHPNNNIPPRKYESFAMIKYPTPINHKNSGPTEIKNKAIFAPYINNIIKDYWNNKKNNNPISFIKNNKNNIFDKNNHFVGIFNGEAQLLKYAGDHLIIDKANNNIFKNGWITKEEFKKLSQPEQKKFLNLNFNNGGAP